MVLAAIRHAGGLTALKTAELCLQVIGRARTSATPAPGAAMTAGSGSTPGGTCGRLPVPGIMFLVTESQELPGSVLAAYERAARAGFQLACEADVGRLLATLAAAVPSGGRVLEIGTGVGVGLAWLVHGLGARQDVEVVTVELDDEVQRAALSAPWPPWVCFESGDGAEVVGRLGQFDLIFPDAPSGKIFKLRRTVAALRRGGVLIVDDMDLTRHDDEQLRSALAVVRHRLLENAELVCAELGFSSGVIVAVKRRS
jgi:demethylmenaquinone methyltransferase/2-methoxy-6-polyprenyl-1,4-benzoquinol methylase